MPTQPTTIVLDQARHLLLKSADIIAMEQWAGVSWMTAAQERSERGLVGFLWAGMRWREPKITPAEVSARLDEARGNGVGIVQLWDGINDLLINSGLLPRVVAAQNGHPPNAAPESPPAPSPGATPALPTG